MKRELKNIIKIIGSLAITVVLILSLTTPSYALLQIWDLVDSGKHLDWNSNTKYNYSLSNGINVWETYKSGVIRPDTSYTIEDVYISDYYEVSNTAGKTSSNGTIKFNDYNFSSFGPNQRTNCCAHELGHALGLDHTNGLTDIMQTVVTMIISLSTTDKESYDQAYSKY